MTHNLKDFPATALAPFDIEAQHPDIFVRRFIDMAPVVVVDAVRAQLAGLRNPPVTLDDLHRILERIGMVETSTALRRLM